MERKIFDCRTATKAQKEVALDCATFLEENGQSMIADIVKANFNLKNLPRIEKELSPFVNLLQSKGIIVSQVGEEIREDEILPVISITAPIDTFDRAFGYIED